ncbi:hypothetical protein BDI4_580008 [Burkholderia diffusa]|nr:hypothetical protein BDI4_580008 [Burkholderia diffusa]
MHNRIGSGGETRAWLTKTVRESRLRNSEPAKFTGNLLAAGIY